MKAQKKPTEADEALGLTASEVAKRLGVSTRGAKFHVLQGRFPNAKRDSVGYWRVPLEDVRAFMVAKSTKADKPSTSIDKSKSKSGLEGDETQEQRRRASAWERDRMARVEAVRETLRQSADATKRREAAVRELEMTSLDEWAVSRMLGITSGEVRAMVAANELRPAPVPEHLRPALQDVTVGLRFTRDEVARVQSETKNAGAKLARAMGDDRPEPSTVERIGRQIVSVLFGGSRREGEGSQA